MRSFKAFLIEEIEGKTQSGFVNMDESQLDPGEVTIRVAFSSVNYKDAIAETGAGRIIRRFPCVGGIDLSGTVEESSDPRFKPGDPVIATSFDIGVAHHGGCGGTRRPFRRRARLGERVRRRRRLSLAESPLPLGRGSG